MNFSPYQYLRYEPSHMHVRQAVFVIWIEDRKPLAASGGSMARYGGDFKSGVWILWYRAMFVPNCKTVAFIVTEEMRAESIVARKIRIKTRNWICQWQMQRFRFQIQPGTLIHLNLIEKTFPMMYYTWQSDQ